MRTAPFSNSRPRPGCVCVCVCGVGGGAGQTVIKKTGVLLVPYLGVKNTILVHRRVFNL